MESDSKVDGAGKATLEDLMREWIRATIEAIVDEELEAALGAARSQRVGSARAGYRHGTRERQLTARLGATTIAMPRARIEDPAGRRREWPSQIILRYQRRTAAGGGGRQPGPERGAQGAVAAARDSALHQSQAVEPARQGPGAFARGTRRGLSAYDLRQQTSSVLVPASCSRSTPMICSSVNRLPFIVRPPFQATDSTSDWPSFRVQATGGERPAAEYSDLK
jgi:hypothetical protein